MTAENKSQTKKNFSFDWLIAGVLTKLGDTFDRLTGRNWNPSSSLATSKLIEKLKFLLDSEIRDLGRDGKFVPHDIKLKMQWDKFSSDSLEDLSKLEHELHAAAIDHINDRLYHTYAPLSINIKTDYFTDGVKMLASFGKFSDKEDDEVAINVTVPDLRLNDFISDNKITVNLSEPEMLMSDDIFIARYALNQKNFEKELNFTKTKRVSIGRSKENDISINDPSVSKIHAALVLGGEKQLMVADTGSTNGTFVAGQRIAYGKALAVEDDQSIRFGTIEVSFERLNPIEDDYSEREELSDESEIAPTRAAVDILAADNIDEISLTQRSYPEVENEIPLKPLNQTAGQEQIQPEPTEAGIEAFEKPHIPANSRESEEGDGEFDSQSQDSANKTSGEVDLRKTQDWEI